MKNVNCTERQWSDCIENCDEGETRRLLDCDKEIRVYRTSMICTERQWSDCIDNCDEGDKKVVRL
jgi:hypothetical protein